MSKDNKKQIRKNAFREIFSASSGYLSSKRILGAIVLMVCLTVATVQCFTEGMTDNIKDIFELMIITSTTLLGISSVTGIWKTKNSCTSKNKYEEE